MTGNKHKKTGLHQPKPILTVTGGFARKEATDEYRLSYIEFEQESYDVHDCYQECEVCGEVYHYNCVKIREAI